jgi:hypothetical protein
MITITGVYELKSKLNVRSQRHEKKESHFVLNIVPAIFSTSFRFKDWEHWSKTAII